MAFYFHLTILTEKVFYSIQYMNGWLAASDVFDASSDMLTQWITYRCLKNVFHQIYNRNEWLLLPASFKAKFKLILVMGKRENAFFKSFILKPTERA